MKRVGNLYPRIADFGNLYLAFRKAFKGAKRSGETLAFYFNMEWELLALRKELAERSYAPGGYRYFNVYDPKERTIAVAPFRDRVVHHAIVNVLEPIYESRFIFDSYATRKDKGTHRAVLRAQEFLRKHQWYLKADIQQYFASVNIDIMASILGRKIKDKDTMRLLRLILDCGGNGSQGLPIGNLTSQFLANVYLDPFDHFVKETLQVKQYIRYMDDLVIFSDDRQKLKDLRGELSAYLKDELELSLKEKSVIINQRSNGLSFLGTRVFPKLIRIKRENLTRSMRRYRHQEREFQAGKIDEETLCQSVQSIVGHMSFYDTLNLRKCVFTGSR